MSDTEALLKRVQDFIGESRRLFEQGAFVELAGMETDIRALCNQVLALSGAERDRYADRLQSLIGELAALGDSMEAARDKITGELGSANRHQKAAVAYRKAYGGKKEDKK